MLAPSTATALQILLWVPHVRNQLQPPLWNMFERLINLLPAKRLFVVYSLLLLACISLMAVFGVFERPNLFFLDRAFNLRGDEEAHPDVVIAAISQEDFERGAPRWPWPRSLMARLVDQIAEQRPAVIAVDIQYAERSNTETLLTPEQYEQIRPYVYQVLKGTELEIQTQEGVRVIGPGTEAFDSIGQGTASANAQDQELADAVARAVDNGVPVVLAAQTVSGAGIQGVTRPYQSLLDAAEGSIGLAGVRLDDDGVLRRYLPYGLDENGGVIYGLALAAVSQYLEAPLPRTPLSGGDVLLGSDTVVDVVDGSFLVNFPGPPGSHLTVTAGDLLNGRPEVAGLLTGKIVFLGVTDPSAEDVVPTPYSGTDRMAGIEFHAGAAGTILNDWFIDTTPTYQVVLMIIGLSLVAVALGRFVRPAYGMAGALAVTGGLFAAWIFSFSAANYSLPIAGPLTALVVSYAVAIADRVGVEQLNMQQARTMLSRYLPGGIVREMLKDPMVAQLGAKRAEVTILFADIRGFTTISEKLPPEEVVAMLNEYLTVMTEVVFRHEGTIDKFEGDAILAFFGAPQAHDDDPQRAVLTAVEMRDQLDGLQAQWRDRTQEDLKIGIGINTGPVMVGNIGSQRRMDYTIIGDAVNLASRLQDLTKETGSPILISGAVRAGLDDNFKVRSLGEIPIRGREQLVSLYEVVGLNVPGPEPESGSPTQVEAKAMGHAD